MGNFFKIKEINIYNKKIKEDIKITLLADLHISNLIKKEKLDKIEKEIKSFKPNYICIAGDLLDHTNILENKEKIEMLKNFLKNIAKVPIFISIGNHDMGKRVTRKENKNKWIYHFPKEFLKDLEKEIPNAHILHNKTYQNKEIQITGYTPPFNSYYGKKECQKALEKDIKENIIKPKETNKLSICLIHNPMCLKNFSTLKVLKDYDLLLAGHMHNGVVPPILDEIWKSNTGIVSPNKKPFTSHARGIIPIKYQNKNNILIIAGGIVKIQETAPKIIWKLDNLFPMSIENIKITSKSRQDYKVKSYYKK